MKRARKTIHYLLAVIALSLGQPSNGFAKSYSSGGGHSYSSSSHSSSSGGSHSFSSGGTHRSSGTSTHSSSGGSSGTRSGSSGSGSTGNKTFGSGGGKSYSSGSTSSDNGRRSYTSAKSYSAGTEHSYRTDSRKGPAASPASSPNSAGDSGSGFAFDNAAARARKEQASKTEFTRFKDEQASPPVSRAQSSPSSYAVKPPPLPAANDYQRRSVYVPDSLTLSTRPVRVYNVFNSYSSRPWVVYHDFYSSFFWWWLLDRSLDDRAWWTYHHRYDMDPARYQDLVARDQQLEARVAELEAQRVPRDPAYTPPGLDRDLMYSDQYLNKSYSNRRTTAGVVGFWVLAVPTALGVTGFFIWLIWFKRWQTST